MKEYITWPILSSRPPLSLPSDMDQLRSLASQLERLREDHYDKVLWIFSAAYLYKQTFALPGSVFLVITCLLATPRS